jgi:hypothetical protein
MNHDKLFVKLLPRRLKKLYVCSRFAYTVVTVYMFVVFLDVSNMYIKISYYFRAVDNVYDLNKMFVVSIK